MKIILRSVILLSSIATTISCSRSSETAAPTVSRPALQVLGHKVVPHSFANDITATANLLASEQVELKAPLAGMVLSIYFKEGEFVREGQSIIRLDDRVWKAQLTGLNAELATAEKELERRKQLLEIEGSSQEEIDIAATTIDKLKSQIAQLQINIQLANVKAPFSGKLGMRNFSLGAFLKEGDVITSLTTTNSLKVDFDLPQEHLSSVKIGKIIHVLVGKNTLEATIYAISPLINSTSRTINVRARLSQKGRKELLPGTYAEVFVSTEYIENALMVPTQAIVPEINNQTVYVYKGGTVQRKTVLLGARTATDVHVLQGLVAGDTVITTGLLQIEDGGQVKLQAVK